MSKKTGTKLTARVDQGTKEQLGDIADNMGLTESDLVRIALKVFIPQFQSGKLDLRKLLKKAA